MRRSKKTALTAPLASGTILLLDQDEGTYRRLVSQTTEHEWTYEYRDEGDEDFRYMDHLRIEFNHTYDGMRVVEVNEPEPDRSTFQTFSHAQE